MRASRTLYDEPVNTFVAGFIGSPAMNLCELPCGSNGSTCSVARRSRCRQPLPRRLRLEPDRARLRPESLELAAEGIPARVEVVEELGADAYVFLRRRGGEEIKLVARCETRHSLVRDARVHLVAARAGRAHVFDPDTGERIPG